MPIFLTLGPEDSNHQFVLQRYLAAQGLGAAARIVLIDDFHDGARRVIAREADYLLQCASILQRPRSRAPTAAICT
jgi:hypothetical protein